MNVLSLFSGIGGLELGLERAGMTVVGQVELDPFCRKVLAKHWPGVPQHDDVRTCVDWWRGEPRPAVHLVAGGYPCTPFSSAGRQLGMADERWGWPWFYDVVRALRPAYVLVENVAALLADRDAFGRMLGDLAEGGYDAEWDCIPAASVGAPHRRDRVFLVAHTDRCGLGEDLGDLSPRESDPGRRSSDVADSDGPSGRPATRDAVEIGGGPEVLDGRPAEPRRRGCPVADANGNGPEWSRVPEARRRGGVADADRRGPRVFGRGLQQRDEWLTEPGVGRVAHGVPARVDRLRSLGNAVVPQVAEHIGQLIVAADRELVAS